MADILVIEGGRLKGFRVKSKKDRQREQDVVRKFLAYLSQEAELCGSYTDAIQIMIDKEKNLLTIKQLNELKKQYRGR